MNKEYLPSRKFVAGVLIIAIIIAIIFGISKLATLFKGKITKSEPTKLLVKDLVQKDTNKNGIPDWEESLWGLDPTANGISNREFISNEKAKLTNNSIIQEGSPVSNENTALSREFFAVIMSLQQSGDLNEDSIKAVSDTLGQKIVADPIGDTYTRDSLNKVVANTANIDTYVKAVGKLMTKYKDKDMGNELNLISQGLMRNDPQATMLAGNIGKVYRSFGQELVKIPVPATLVDLDLALANDYDRVAQSIEGLTKILTDPIIGMRAIINYKRYSDNLVADIENLSDNY